jgi:hypothetical protein
MVHVLLPHRPFQCLKPQLQCLDLGILGFHMRFEFLIQPLNGGQRDSPFIHNANGSVAGSEAKVALKSCAIGPTCRTPAVSLVYRQL